MEGVEAIGIITFQPVLLALRDGGKYSGASELLTLYQFRVEKRLCSLEEDCQELPERAFRDLGAGDWS